MYYNANIVSGFVDDRGVFWVADRNNGLIRQSYSPYDLQKIAPNGPRSAAVWAMDSREGKTWVATGSLNGDAVNYDARNGSYLFADNTWNTYNTSNDNYIRNDNDSCTASVFLMEKYADSTGRGIFDCRK